MKLKNKKEDFLVCCLGTLGAVLLGNILAGKGLFRAGDGAITKRQSRRMVRAGYQSTI